MTSKLGFLAIYGYVQFLLCPAHVIYALITGSTNAFAVTHGVCQAMDVQFYHTKSSHAIGGLSMKTKQIIYICNHVSWADFFIDQAVTGGSAYLSRLMVWFGTPMSSLYGWISHSTWFFNRKSGVDRDLLAKWMDGEWSIRPEYGMVAYPEGTRNQSGAPLKLKTGVLEYAYKFKRPIQCVITAHKEDVVNEKKFSAQRGQRILTAVSKVTDPADFKDKESFIEAIRQIFVETWNDAHQCTFDDAIKYDPPYGHSPPIYEPVPRYSRVVILRLIVICILAIWIGSRGNGLASKFELLTRKPL